MSTYWLKYRGTRFPIRRGETVVGRSPYCTIVLSNPLSSRQHCALRLEEGTLSIADLDSANGTWLNDVRISGAEALAPGDVIRVGTDVLEVLPVQDSNCTTTRPTTHGRTIRETSREFAAPELGSSDAELTVTSPTHIELVEALVASAAETRRPLNLAPTIQRAIEGIIQKSMIGKNPLPRSETTRLAAVVEILASWSEEDELGEWRLRTLAALDAHPE